MKGVPLCVLIKIAKKLKKEQRNGIIETKIEFAARKPLTVNEQNIFWMQCKFCSLSGYREMKLFEWDCMFGLCSF